MKITDKLKSVGFWISLISAAFLILGAFGVEIGNDVSSMVINAVSSLFLVLGMAVEPVTTIGSSMLTGISGGTNEEPADEKKDEENKNEEKKEK